MHQAPWVILCALTARCAVAWPSPCATTRGASIFVHATQSGHRAANIGRLTDASVSPSFRLASRRGGFFSGMSLRSSGSRRKVSVQRAVCVRDFCVRRAMHSAASCRRALCPALLWTGPVLVPAASSVSQMQSKSSGRPGGGRLRQAPLRKLSSPFRTRSRIWQVRSKKPMND